MREVAGNLFEAALASVRYGNRNLGGMPEMPAQSGVKIVTNVVGQNANIDPALLGEQVKIPRKRAAAQKRWWQDCSLLIADIAFLLSLCNRSAAAPRMGSEPTAVAQRP